MRTIENDVQLLRKVQRELRDLKMNHKDTENMRQNLYKEKKELEERVNLAKQRELSMLKSLVQERIDLVARTFRIDQRIEVLGYSVDAVMRWAAKMEEKNRS